MIENSPSAKVNILNVPFNKVSKVEALEKLKTFLDSNQNHMIVTPNPEIVMAAQEDNELLEIIKKADLVIADGIGIIIGSKIQRKELVERVPGCDLLLSLFKTHGKQNLSVYLLGAKPGVVEISKKNIEDTYENVFVVGYHHGYFDEKQEEEIVAQIKLLKPDVLVVGLGCPRQEKWISKYKDQLPVKISAGLGGSIDSIAGTVKRAPKVVQILGLEWLFRAILQPVRFKRLMKIPVFILKVMLER